jgi:hypothetical protein
MVPKRRKVVADEYVTLYERCDRDRLEQLCRLRLPHKLEATLRTYRLRLKKTDSDSLRIRYEQKTTGGRFFAKDASLQSVSGWICRTLTAGMYWDIDVENCAPTCLLHQFTVHDVDVPPLLFQYVSDRQEFIQQRLPGFSRGFVKKAILSVIHDGDYTVILGREVPLLNAMKAEIESSMERLRGKVEYADMWFSVQEKPHPKATFTAYMWQQLESEILMHMYEYFTSNGFCVGVLKHDGLLVERTGRGCCPVSVLRACESSIEITVGISVKLNEKPHDQTESDIDKFYGPMHLRSLKTDLERVKYMCVREAMQHGYKRMGLNILAPHSTIPGVFTELPDHKGQAQTYINHVIGKHMLNLSCMEKAVNWFERVHHPRFEVLNRASFDDTIISFLDGFLNTRSKHGTPMVFTNWRGYEGDPPVTRHYFDQPFPQDAWEENQFDTPKWNRILSDQLMFEDGDDEVIKCMECMIGRLFYPIKTYDNWQVCPMVIGDANTGKSSMVDVIRSMFPPMDVGVIASSLEQQFGLDAVVDKRLVVVPDMPTDIHKKLNAADFQSMVTGDNMSIARKYKKAEAHVWSATMFWVGNEYPNWKDKKGSIRRRLAIFKYEHLIETRVTNLVQDIIRDERVLIMLRCLRTYRQRAYEIEGEDWQENSPDKLKEWSQEASIQMNPLAEFLANGSDYYQIVHQVGAMTSLNDFRQAFVNYMTFDKGIKGYRLGTDRHITKSAGFPDVVVNVCTTCDKPSSRRNCKDHYNRQNRRRRSQFMNMRIIKLKDREQHQHQFVL